MEHSICYALKMDFTIITDFTMTLTRLEDLLTCYSLIVFPNGYLV